MRYFFYGSLMDRTVASIVIGRTVAARELVPATLPGFWAVRVSGEHYPALRARADATVEGVVLDDVTAEQQRRLQYFEADEFLPVPMLVTRADRSRCTAQVFMPVDGISYSDEAWTYEAFVDRAGPDFLEHTRHWMCGFGQATTPTQDKSEVMSQRRSTHCASCWSRLAPAGCAWRSRR